MNNQTNFEYSSNGSFPLCTIFVDIIGAAIYYSLIASRIFFSMIYIVSMRWEMRSQK